MIETTSSQSAFKLPLCIHLTSLFHKSTTPLHIPNELLSSITLFLKTISMYYNIYSDINEEELEKEEEEEEGEKNGNNQSYRKMILHLIDPHHLYFEPYGQIPTCKNKTIHIGDDLDDYLNNRNFIYLRPFKLYSDNNSLLTIPLPTSPTTKNNTQSPDEENLQALTKTLISIYQQYEKEKDIGKIIQEKKKKVLSNVICTFSGVIPIEQEATQHRLWKLTHHYGATLSYDLTGKVTHLIATRTGTTKVNKASHYAKIHIVTLSWLLNSLSRWQVQNESFYPLVSSVPPSTVVTPVSTPLGNDDDIDEGDDEKDKENKKIDQLMLLPPLPPMMPFHGKDNDIDEDEDLDDDDENDDDDDEELITLQSNEIHDIDKIDWDEADKEVNDYIYESGTDDYLSSGPDSPLPEPNRKRKQVLFSNSRKKNKPLHSWSLRQSKERGPSKLSTTTLFNNTIDRLSNSSSLSSDDDDEDDDTSFLNTLAGELDNEIE
ncbi:unnamed protein product [Cunninghamella echinulata]